MHRRMMVKVVHLRPGEQPPDETDYVLIEADSSGLFFGTGFGRAEDGSERFYISRSEDDLTLDSAIAAAVRWAKTRRVECVYVAIDGVE